MIVWCCTTFKYFPILYCRMIHLPHSRNKMHSVNKNQRFPSSHTVSQATSHLSISHFLNQLCLQANSNHKCFALKQCLVDFLQLIPSPVVSFSNQFNHKLLWPHHLANSQLSHQHFWRIHLLLLLHFSKRPSQCNQLFRCNRPIHFPLVAINHLVSSSHNKCHTQCRHLHMVSNLIICFPIWILFHQTTSKFGKINFLSM